MLGLTDKRHGSEMAVLEGASTQAACLFAFCARASMLSCFARYLPCCSATCTASRRHM